MKKFLQLCLLCLLWLVLTAQGKFEVSSFTPKSQQIEPTPEGLAIVGAILSFVIILIIYRNKLRKKFEEQLRQNYNRHLKVAPSQSFRPHLTNSKWIAPRTW